MKKSIVMLVMVGLVSSLSMPAFAIKQLNDKFVEIYGSEGSKDSSEALKTAIKEAKCNICHVGGDKKKRNPYGEALEKEFKAASLSVKEYGKDVKNPKYEKIADLFKKVSEQKAGTTDKTFAARMKDGELPGGDKEGKGLPGAK